MAHEMQYRSLIATGAKLYMDDSPSLEPNIDAVIAANPNQGVVKIVWATENPLFVPIQLPFTGHELILNNFCGYSWDDFLEAIEGWFKLSEKDHSHRGFLG
jgi:hypothetical protein